MQLMREIDVPHTQRDLVFRASRLYAVLFVIVCLWVCALMILRGWPHPRIAYIVTACIVFFLLLGHRFVSARFHPSNWLVRVGDEGLFIHFRSYLNEGLDPNDATVIFLAFQEIRSARLVHEHLETKDAQNRTQTQFLKWIELELAIDPAAIVDALGTERGRPAPSEKRWYGKSSTLYLDYPVLMQTPPFLRIAWRVVPTASDLLELLRPPIEIAPEVTIKQDFIRLDSLPPEDQRKRLRELSHRGQTFAAIYLARHLYGYDLTQATNLVKELQGETQA